MTDREILLEMSKAYDEYNHKLLNASYKDLEVCDKFQGIAYKEFRHNILHNTIMNLLFKWREENVESKNNIE